MTREEAIRIAKGLRTDFKCESDTMVDFCDTIIKALDQELILDKISANIIQAYCTAKSDFEFGYNYGLYKAAQFINNYIEEVTHND